MYPWKLSTTRKWGSEVGSKFHPKIWTRGFFPPPTNQKPEQRGHWTTDGREKHQSKLTLCTVERGTLFQKWKLWWIYVKTWERKKIRDKPLKEKVKECESLEMFPVKMFHLFRFEREKSRFQEREHNLTERQNRGEDLPCLTGVSLPPPRVMFLNFTVCSIVMFTGSFSPSYPLETHRPGNFVSFFNRASTR